MSGRKDRFFQMRVDERFLQRLDDLRRAEPDLPSRTEMARRLIEIVFELAESELSSRKEAKVKPAGSLGLLRELEQLLIKGQFGPTTDVPR
jgi:hypothetical protein